MKCRSRKPQRPPRRPRALGHVLAGLAGALLLLGPTAARARAQIPVSPGDTQAPLVISPHDTTYTGPVAPPAPAITVCDNTGILTGSLQVTLNGADVTGHYGAVTTVPSSTCPSTANKGAVRYPLATATPLVRGSNTLRVQVCDPSDNCADRTFTLNWVNAAPTATFSPASSRVSNPSLALTVIFHDDDSVRVSSARFLLNGADVTGQFHLTSQQFPQDAYFSGTLQLSTSGTNTVTASVSDNTGQGSGPLTATYTVGTTAPTITFSAPARTGTASPAITLTLHEDDQQITSNHVWMNGVPVSGLSATYGVFDVTLSGTVAAQAGDNVLTAEACSAGGCARDSTHVFRYTATHAVPALGLAPTNQDWRLPSPTELTQSYSTPAYVSRDRARALTLAYASGLANPQAFIQVDASDYSSDAPTQMTIAVLDAKGAGVQGTNTAYTNFYRSGNGTSRLGFRFRTGTLATGAYTYTVVVRSYFSDGTYQEARTPLRVLVLNQVNSPYGAGWYLAGVQRIYPQGNDLVVDNGDGTAALFAYVNTTPDNVRHYRAPPGDFSLLEYDGASATYSRGYPDGTNVAYTGAGLMSSATDRYGSTRTLAWAAAAGGRDAMVSAVTDEAGKTTGLAATAGLLTSITGPDGRAEALAYGTSGDLQTIRDPDGVTAFTGRYSTASPLHLLQSWTDRAGGTWTPAYDAGQELQSLTSPAALLATGGASQSTVTALRSLAAVVVPGATTQAAPAAQVTPDLAWLRVTAPSGDSTLAQLDHWGVPARVRDAQGRVAVVLRDSLGRDSLSVSATGDSVRKTWAGPDVATRKTAAGTETFTYDAFHQLATHTWGGDTQDVSNTYDAQGRLLRAWMGGAPVRYTWDAAGRLKTVGDSAGRTQSFAYETGGFQNLQAVTAPNGLVTQYAYDASGRLQRMTDPRGKSTTLAYDALDRRTSTTGPIADTTRFAYTGADATWLAAVTDPIAQRYGYGRNVLGWSLADTDPRGGTTQHGFNAYGALTQSTNRRGQVVTTRYDDRGRVVARYADGDSTTFVYDPADRFTVARNAASLDTLRFDAGGAPTEAVAVRGTRRYVVRSTYTEGLRTVVQTGEDLGMLSGGETFSYRYTGGVLNSVHFGNNGPDSAAFKYNADGRPRWLDLPAGVRVNYSYTTGVGFPVGTSYTDLAGTGRADLNRAAGELLSVDSLSRIDGWTLATQDSMYRYRFDDAGRLVESDKYGTGLPSDGTVITCSNGLTTGFQCQSGGSTPPSPSELLQYGYDRAGNRTDRGAVIQSGNRLAVFNGLNLEYDADGNVTRLYKTSGGTVTWDRQLAWNSLGQLTQVCTNGSCIGYRYDGFGRRVLRTDGTGRVIGQWVHDGDQLALELDGSGNVTASYTYLPGVDLPLSMTRGGQRYYYLRDHLGSIRALVSATGQLVNQYRYDPWGARVSATEGVQNPLQYAAHELDQATDLYYNRARYYSPGLARFASEDPSGLTGGMNPYAYAANDPVNLTDATGLDPLPGVSQQTLQHIRDACAQAYKDVRSYDWCVHAGILATFVGMPPALSSRGPRSAPTPAEMHGVIGYNAMIYWQGRAALARLNIPEYKDPTSSSMQCWTNAGGMLAGAVGVTGGGLGKLADYTKKVGEQVKDQPTGWVYDEEAGALVPAEEATVFGMTGRTVIAGGGTLTRGAALVGSFLTGYGVGSGAACMSDPAYYDQ